MLKLTDNDFTRAMWPFAFEATYEARAPAPSIPVFAATQLMAAQRRQIENHISSYFHCSQVTLRSGRLKLEMKVMNNDDKPLSFTAALHTYLEVVDVGVPAVRVTGLQGKTYLDKVPDPKKPVEKARR